MKSRRASRGWKRSLPPSRGARSELGRSRLKGGRSPDGRSRLKAGRSEPLRSRLNAGRSPPVRGRSPKPGLPPKEGLRPKAGLLPKVGRPVEGARRGGSGRVPASRSMSWYSGAPLSCEAAACSVRACFSSSHGLLKLGRGESEAERLGRRSGRVSGRERSD